MASIGQAARRLLGDRLINLVSGLGTYKDKTVTNAFVLNQLTQADLEAAYRSDWLSRKIIDIPAQDMTREWRAWQADEDKIKLIEAVEKLLGVQAKVTMALQMARLGGGAAIFIGTGDSDPEQPLNVDGIKKDGVKYLHVFNRWELPGGDIDKDVLSQYYGQPQYYRLGSSGIGPGGVMRGEVKIHPSRIVRFKGACLPDPRSQNTDGWDDSVLQVVYDAVQTASASVQTVAALIPEAKIDVISVPNLSEYLSTTEGTRKVTERFQLSGMLKSLHNLLLIEGSTDGTGEQWQQKQLQFTQFPDLLRFFLQIASGAADIPVTRLLGQSPAGLNATGESDIRNYYDGLASRQETDLRPGIDTLDKALIRSALGDYPDDVFYEWRPLWQLSEKEKAEIAKIKADATTAYSTNGMVPPEVLTEGVRNQLIEDGTYPGIEEVYQDYDDGLLVPPVDPNVDPNTPEDPALVDPTGDPNAEVL